MQSGNQESFLNIPQKLILAIFFFLIIGFLFVFKNLLFQPSLVLKNFGKFSVDPEIAFKSNKPIFLEFYAEWCEVCKEMAPKIALLKDKYETDINFVFLNVDNPKWESYIRKFNVNGIPQINTFNSELNLQDIFIGKQEEKIIKESLENLNNNSKNKFKNVNSKLSLIKDNKNYQFSPRSHG